MTFRHSLVVGKFAPLHLGHLHLIRTALAESEAVTVLVYARPDFPEMPQAVRAGWLRQEFPRLDVREPRDPPPDAADEWTHRVYVRDWLARQGLTVDAAFTSEDYGPGFAAVLGVHHCMVDRARIAFPVSGTILRGDLAAHAAFLAPSAHVWLLGHTAVDGKP